MNDKPDQQTHQLIIDEPSETNSQRSCAACMEETHLNQTLKCPCSHIYCHGCVEKFFELAMFNESTFPPRCCGQTIPPSLCQDILSTEQISKYETKTLEYNTKNRTYSYLPDCSAFIPPSLTHGNTGTCEKCECKTCIICKGPSHEEECPEDEATEEVFRIAAEMGWQTCYSCSRIVELSSGCNHMTCPCGAQFCYVCGVEWKNCGCDQWNEDRLVDPANAIGVGVPPRADLEAQLMRVMFRLRVGRQRHPRIPHDECLHAGLWESVNAQAECNECGEVMRQFIYRCRNCRAHRCRRCRDNF